MSFRHSTDGRWYHSKSVPKSANYTANHQYSCIAPVKLKSIQAIFGQSPYALTHACGTGFKINSTEAYASGLADTFLYILLKIFQLLDPAVFRIRKIFPILLFSIYLYLLL